MSLAFGQAYAGIARSMGSRGDCFDSAVARDVESLCEEPGLGRISNERVARVGAKGSGRGLEA